MVDPKTGVEQSYSTKKYKNQVRKTASITRLKSRGKKDLQAQCNICETQQKKINLMKQKKKKWRFYN